MAKQRAFLKRRRGRESLVDQLIDDNGEVVGEGALGGATTEKAVCLAEDAVVLELRREETGVVCVGSG